MTSRDRKRLTPVAALTLFAVATLGLIDAADASASWVADGVRDGVRLWYREVPDSDVYAWRGRGLLPWDIDHVASVVTDVEAYAGYMPHMTVSRRLSTGEASGLPQYYVRLRIPTLADRDYVVDARSTWRGEGPDRSMVLAFSAVATAQPLNSDVIRITELAARWTLRSAGPDRTLVEYQSYVKMGGSLPDFLANSGGRDAVVAIFDALRVRCDAVMQ